MRTRAHNEDGFLLIELMTATLILTIALLALIGAYSLGYYAISSSGQTMSATLLANNQLELYASLPYASIGLDQGSFSSARGSDANYSSDESALPVSGTDVTIAGCGSSPQCLAVQTLTGADHKTYKLETFIRLVSNPNGSSRSELVITEIVRNMSAAGTPQVAVMQTARDLGP